MSTRVKNRNLKNVYGNVLWDLYFYANCNAHPQILRTVKDFARSYRLLTSNLQTVIVYERLFSHPGVVEFAIAEMACVSSNVRRTFHVPSGVRVQRSISERDVSHPI